MATNVQEISTIIEKLSELLLKKYSLPTGFEPVRAEPNGFRVHRLNHSATTAYVPIWGWRLD